MSIILDGTNGITAPDLNVTAQSSNIVTTGNVNAANMTLSGGVFLGGTGSPNLLDDYEEGTWTPVNSGGMTGFTAIDGTYTKIGRTVQVRGSFSITAVTTNMELSGLPFASMDKTFHSIVDENIPVAIAFRRVEANSTTIQWNVNATGSFSVNIQFTAWYFTA